MKHVVMFPFLLAALFIMFIPIIFRESIWSVVFSVLALTCIGWGVINVRSIRPALVQPLEGTNVHEPVHLPVTVDQERFLESMRHQRHDWLNHFQVVLGYLQIGRYDLCEEYIRRVTDITNNDSRVAQLGVPKIVAYLLTFNAINKEMQIEVDLPEPIDLRKCPGLPINLVYEIMTGVIEIYNSALKGDHGEPSSLVLHIQKLDNIFYMSYEFEGQQDAQTSLQGLYELVEKLGNEQCSFVEGLHNNEESIMEFYVPLLVEDEVKR